MFALGGAWVGCCYSRPRGKATSAILGLSRWLGGAKPSSRRSRLRSSPPPRRRSVPLVQRDAH